MATIPQTFVDLATAYRSPVRSTHNVIGIVVDIMPPTVTRKGQHMVTFKLMDPSFDDGVFDDNGSQINGLKIRFFRHKPEDLPQVKQQGDIMVLRSIRMEQFDQQKLGINHYQTRAVVFPITAIHDPNTELLYKPMTCLGLPQDTFLVEQSESNYVIQLKRDMRSIYESLPPPSSNDAATVRKYRYPGDESTVMAPAPPRPLFGPKFKLVKDLRHRDFADICGQVVKKFYTDRGTELYITDYTENKEMFFYAPPEMLAQEGRDGDDYGYAAGTKKQWPGPYGRLVLKVNTKHPHATFARDSVNEGDFVFLKNVKMKIMADGAKLEADMWPDDRNPDKVQIEKSQKVMTSQQVEDIEERKQKYWASREVKAATNDNEAKQKMTRGERRRLKKQQKRDAPAPIEAKSGDQVNPNIRCGQQDVPISSIRTILDPENKAHTCKMPNGKTQTLPFVNAKYRTRARVIDYYPKEIEEFTLPSNDPRLGAPTNPNSSQTHEWSFELLLEDATKPKASIDKDSDTLWVALHHEEAQYLFGNTISDPTDLHKDRALLAKVKQQLFLLWGNLEEKKDDEELSNRPFECCLVEHGVEMDDDDPAKATTPFGWKRIYSMFGTTIV